MMQPLTTKESLTRSSKASTNNKKQLEENDAKTAVGKIILDVKFSKKEALKMAKVMIQSNNKNNEYN